MSVEMAYQALGLFSLLVLSALLFACLVRSIRGPKVVDRIVSVNMIGTLTIILIGVLAVMMREGYLADVALIYAMISFLAVVVLCKVYMGVYMQRQKEETDGKEAKKEDQTNA